MRILGALTAGAVLVTGATALTAGTSAPARAARAAPSPSPSPSPEADLAYHGRVTMAAGRVDVRLVAHNHGPSPVDDATVRLRWSARLADRQSLPHRCARSDAWTVVCGTGELPADGPGEEIRLRVRLADTPSEVLMEIATAWNGGDAVDHNHRNDHQRVLTLDTGDAYRF